MLSPTGAGEPILLLFLPGRVRLVQSSWHCICRGAQRRAGTEREEGKEQEEKGGSFSPVAGGSPGV